MTAQVPIWFENLFAGWWGTLILSLFCVLDVMLLSVLFYRAFMKRFYDIVLSLAAIVVLIPVWLVLTPVVAIKMKGNPFFVQERPGKKCKIFKLIKYRTMTTEKDADGNNLPDAQRLTRFGRVLRKLSLDELPELFNIFAGQMSLVGPRPLLVQYLPLYTVEQMRRHAVRPGLTGLAQVSGRNAVTWDERFRLDVRYVDRYSFFGDLKILFLTVFKVLRREGISEEGQATKSYFTGSAAMEAAAAAAPAEELPESAPADEATTTAPAENVPAAISSDGAESGTTTEPTLSDETTAENVSAAKSSDGAESAERTTESVGAEEAAAATPTDEPYRGEA